MKKQNFKRTKLACYAAYFTMSSVFCVPPMLFVTFRETYGISYTLLGSLVLTNFCTQLIVDLIFTLFSKHFNIKRVVRTMPLITSLGLLIYAVVPSMLPQYAYLGLFAGTVMFSVSAGLSEVLLSPTIAAIPSDNPQKDMSLLHSIYAFGVFVIVVFSTVFLKISGTENWMYLVGVLAILPVIAAILFMLSPMPDMSDTSDLGGTVKASKKRKIGLLLCVACLFFGSCAENAMTNWISGYMENALKIDKAVGDILGVAMFSVLLGMTRLSYGKFGKNMYHFLLVSMIGSAICYFVAGFSSNIGLSFFACIMTGVFTAMLWPGTLIMMEENIPGVGVAAYALMAAGGDLGASVSPQLMGIVIDKVAAGSVAKILSPVLNLSAEQIGMKAGMIVSGAFPVIGTVLLIFTMRYIRNLKNE